MANLTPDDRVAKRRTTTSLNSGDNQEHNDIIISLHNSHVRKKNTEKVDCVTSTYYFADVCVSVVTLGIIIPHSDVVSLMRKTQPPTQRTPPPSLSCLPLPPTTASSVCTRRRSGRVFYASFRYKTTANLRSNETSGHRQSLGQWSMFVTDSE